MRVQTFEFDEWLCEWNGRKGTHTFTSPGRPTIVIHSNAIPGASHTTALPLRFARVDRTLTRRLLAWASLPPRLKGFQDPTKQPGDLVGFGNVTDGDEQGGGGITLMPTWEPGTREAMDGTIERHPCFAFDAATGEPLGRTDGEQYTLDAATPNTGYPSQLTPFIKPYAGKYERWQRIDGAHLIRAYAHAVAQYAKDRDPVARFVLINVAWDVLRSYAVSLTNGWSLASMEANVALTPHTGGLGITRWNAWSLRAVVEAQRVAPCEAFRDWIVRYVGVLYLGQAENGALERHTIADGLDQSEPYVLFGLGPQYEYCTSWMVPFMVRALREAARVVPECYTHARTIMARIKPWRSYVHLVPGEDGSQPGLPRYLVIGESGRLVDTIEWGVGPARPYYDADEAECMREMGL